MSMIRNLRMRLAERLMGGLWKAFRSQIEMTVVPGGGGIVMLGDSLTHFGKWDLLFPGLPIKNYGIGGEITPHVLARLGPVIAQRPEQLFVLIGSNDIARGFELEEIAQNIGALVDRVAKEVSGCQIILQNIMPRQRKYATKIQRLNELLAGVAQDRGIPLIDLYPVMNDGTGKMRSDYTWDNIHLNGAGYLAWRTMLMPYLNAKPASGSNQ